MARPLTITAVGNAQVDTANKKFGSGSLLLDGSGDYLTINNSSNDIYATSDWCVECWIYLENPVANEDGEILGTDINNPFTNDNKRFLFEYALTPGSNTAFFRFTCVQRQSGATTSGDVNYFDTLSDVVDGWHHLAVTRSGSTLKIYRDGVLKATATSQAYTDLISQENPSFNRNVFIGYQNSAIATPTYFKGWIDDFRISDTIRYTTGFTAPTASLQPDANTLLLIHADGADGSTTFTDDIGVQAESNLIISTTLSGTATDNPSIVFLGREDYTWDDVNIDWDTWYKPTIPLSLTWDQLDYAWDDLSTIDGELSYDLWQATETQDVGFDLWTISYDEILASTFTIDATVTSAVFGEAELSASTEISTIAGFLVDAEAELSALGFLVSDSRLSDVRGSAELQSQIDMSVIGGLLVDAESTLNALGNFTVLGTAVRQDTVTLSSTFDITVDAVIERNASAVLNSTTTLTAQADLIDFGSAVLVSQFDISVIGSNTLAGFSGLDITTEISISADILPQGNADLTSQFAMVVDAEIFRTASAVLSCSSVLDVQAQLDISASANLDVDSNIETSARILKLAEIELINFATLDATASVSISANAILNTQIDMDTKGGRIVQPLEIYEYTWDSLELWDAFPIDQWSPDGFLAFDNLRLATTGGLLHSGASIFTNDIFVDTDADIFRGGKSNLHSEFVLSAETIKLVRGSAELHALALQLTAGGIIKDPSVIELISQFNLDAITTVTVDGRAELSALGFVVGDGRLSDVRGAANLALSFNAIFAGEIKLLDSDFIYRVLPELRTIGRPLVNYRTPRTITTYGGIQISQVQAKFGSSSALITNIGDVFTVSGTTDLYNGDFTVDMWIWNANLTQMPNGMIWDIRTSASSGLYVYVSYGSIGLFEGITGKGLTNAGFVNSSWNHIAIVRNSNNLKIFVNGVQKISATVTTTNYSSRTSYIGGTYLKGTPLRGYIDEVRLSNTARYTANFTAPTSPFTNDEYTKALIHLNGTFEDDVKVRSMIKTDTEISSETRQQPIPYETRNTTVPSEQRQQPITAETRVLEIDY